MDPVVQSIIAHADRAIRQLPAAQQAEALDELRARMEGRQQKRPALLHFEEKGCAGKVAHPDRGTAEAARLRHKNAVRLAPYECGYCRLWHLGHKRRG